MFNQIVGAILYGTGFFVLGLTIGYLVTRKHMNPVIEKLMKPFGTLRIDYSDDHPHMFLEIESGIGVDDISKNEKVVFRVDTTSYLDM